VSSENTFTLWNPIVDADRCGCHFDVRPREFVQISRGAEPLISEFLLCLSIKGKASAWVIKPFCSPYFAGAEPGENYLDRYPLAWRVGVRLLKPCERDLELNEVFGPHPCGGVDPTWQETDDSWVWRECECVIIVDLPEPRWRETLHKLQSEPTFELCRDFTTLRITSQFIQTRFHLGRLRFPAESGRVDAFLDSCKRMHASVNWATSLRMVLDRRARRRR
jgi:hypothetical protein